VRNRTTTQRSLRYFVTLLSLAIAFAGGCKSAAVSAKLPANSSEACKLLSSADIEAVQGEEVKEVKGSTQTGERLAISQCFYTTANFANSVSLTLTQTNPGTPNSESIREFWEEKFAGTGEREKEHDKEKKRDKREEREEEESQPLLHIDGVGDDAYWEGDKRVGALNVLKGDRFLRLSIGGSDVQEAKISKLKRLATEALKRF
jgi:hypothetical protein